MNEFFIDVSKILYLKDSPYFFFISEFIKRLDTENLDNLYYDIIKDCNKDLSSIFNILSKVYYYITFLVNSKNPMICDYKVLKYHITKEKIIIKVKIKEL